MRSRFKPAVIVIGIIFLVSAALGISSLLRSRSLDALIQAEATPSDAKVTFNGAAAKNGDNKVKAGTYVVVFSREGFKQESRQVTVNKQGSQYVGVVLIPTDPKFANWYSEHPEDARIAEGISSKSFDQTSENQLNQNPFIKSLPYVRATYRVDYGISKLYPNDATKFAIYISYTTNKDKQSALDWIKKQGANPASLEIIFQKY